MVEASPVTVNEIGKSTFFQWLETEKGLNMQDYYEDLSDATKLSLQQEFEGCEYDGRICAGVSEQLCVLLGLM